MKKIIYAVLSFAPVMAFAQTADISGLQQLVTSIGRLMSSIIPIIFALAIIYFFWGMVQFLMGAGDEKKLAAGKAHMIYGVIAIAVMLSIYGLTAWLRTNLGVNSNNPIDVPIVNNLGR